MSPIESSVEVRAGPTDGCLCPRQSYHCRAESVTGMSLVVASNPTDQVYYTIFLSEREQKKSRSGLLEYTFSEEREGNIANITAQILMTDPQGNGTMTICEAHNSSGDSEEVKILVCMIGKVDGNGIG